MYHALSVVNISLLHVGCMTASTTFYHNFLFTIITPILFLLGTLAVTHLRCLSVPDPSGLSAISAEHRRTLLGLMSDAEREAPLPPAPAWTRDLADVAGRKPCIPRQRQQSGGWSWRRKGGR